MARTRKKTIAKVKLQLEAGRATPAPPVGRDLGPHGVNLAEFVRQYNDATRDQNGAIVPAVVTIYEDRSFSLVTKTPTTAYLVRRAAGVEKGSGSPGHNGGPPRTRRVVGVCLVLLLSAMFPANVNAALNGIELGGRAPAELWLRMPMQLLFIAMLWWTAVRA